MSEKRKLVDKTHPDFPAYLEKCKSLASWCDSEHAKIKPSGGKDGPSTAIDKEHARRLIELQKEYAYLFTVEE